MSDYVIAVRPKGKDDVEFYAEDGDVADAFDATGFPTQEAAREAAEEMRAWCPDHDFAVRVRK